MLERKLDAKRYRYEKLFTVKLDQNARSCTVVGRDDEGRYIDGHERRGALCLTVYDKSIDRFVVILASATD